MRSKAEALAKPMAGDRWRIPSGTTIVILRNMRDKITWARTPIGKWCYREPLTRIVRWLIDAEYLGGSE